MSNVTHKVVYKETLCARYWSERRNPIVAILYTFGILGLIVFIMYMLNIYPNYNANTMRYAYYGCIPLGAILIATMIPSTKLLTEMLSTEVVECPLGRD